MVTTNNNNLLPKWQKYPCKEYECKLFGRLKMSFRDRVIIFLHFVGCTLSGNYKKERKKYGEWNSWVCFEIQKKKKKKSSQQIGKSPILVSGFGYINTFDLVYIYCFWWLLWLGFNKYILGSIHTELCTKSNDWNILLF